jgi:hypothetical protein
MAAQQPTQDPPQGVMQRQLTQGLLRVNRAAWVKTACGGKNSAKCPAVQRNHCQQRLFWKVFETLKLKQQRLPSQQAEPR